MLAEINSMWVLYAVAHIVELVGRYGGLLCLIISIFMFLMAHRDNDGPKAETAKKMFIIAICGLCISLLITPAITLGETLLNTFYETLGIAE